MMGLKRWEGKIIGWTEHFLCDLIYAGYRIPH